MFLERSAHDPPLVLVRREREHQKAMWDKTPATAVLVEIVKSLRPHLIHDQSIASIIGERMVR